MESVIGPEIYSNPVQHARIKPPRRALPAGATDANVAATLWHQDAAVVDRGAEALIDSQAALALNGRWAGNAGRPVCA